VIDPDDWLAAWNSPDFDLMVARCADDVEVLAVTLGVDARTYSGREGVRKWMEEVRERFHARVRPERVTPLDDNAFILDGTLMVDDEISGRPEPQGFAILHRLRDGKIYWLSTAITADEAREAWQRGVGE
jgi:ketosteroid isomerase-like protein